MKFHTHGNIPDFLSDVSGNRDNNTQHKKDLSNTGSINDDFESTFYNLSKSRNISDNVSDNYLPFEKLKSKSLGKIILIHLCIMICLELNH
jgi:hypothetical protein